VSTPALNRKNMWGTIFQVIKHRESTGLRQNSNNREPDIVNHLHSCHTISLNVVTQRLVNFPPICSKCTQHLRHSDDSTSGVKMFLRVVILFFAATCCTARVIGKALDTNKFGRQPICNRCRREASCHLLRRHIISTYIGSWYYIGKNV